MNNTKSKYLRKLTNGAALLLVNLFTLQAHAGTDAPLPAVGPGMHTGSVEGSGGSLMVFSRTEETQWGEGSHYYPHTAYWIYDAAGKRIKTVENHDSSTDEAPENVELSPGNYTVKAWSDHDGLVTVPVKIKKGFVTKVRLEDGGVGDREAIDPARAVTTAGGQVVGWKA